MDEAALKKIRQLREVAAKLRERARDMTSSDYLHQVIKSAEELESMALSLEQQIAVGQYDSSQELQPHSCIAAA